MSNEVSLKTSKVDNMEGLVDKRLVGSFVLSDDSQLRKHSVTSKFLKELEVREEIKRNSLKNVVLLLIE